MRSIRDDDMIGRGSQGEDGGKREKEMRMEDKGRGYDRARRKGFAAMRYTISDGGVRWLQICPISLP